MQKLMTLALAVCIALPAVSQESAKKTTGNAAKPSEEKSAVTRPSEATVNSFLEHTFGYDENLKWKVADIKPGPDPSLTEITVVMTTPEGQQSLKLYVTPDGNYAVNGQLIPFGKDPYAAARETLAKRVNGPQRGAANPAVTIVEFGDLQCPSCKKAQPTVEKLMTDVPTARLVFQQFPLTQIHHWAMIAAKYSECVYRQNHEAFWKYIDTVYQHQDEMQPLTEEQAAVKLKAYAGDVGVNADQASQCTSDPSVAAAIQKSMDLGKEMDVQGTPTLFIGGRKIGGVNEMSYDLLKQVTEFQAKKQ